MPEAGNIISQSLKFIVLVLRYLAQILVEYISIRFPSQHLRPLLVTIYYGFRLLGK